MMMRTVDPAEVFAPGSHWLLHLPPGWEVCGTVREVVLLHDIPALVLDGGLYVENVSTGVHALAAAASVAEARRVATACHAIPDGMVIPLHVVTHATPMIVCPHDLVDAQTIADAVR